MTRGQRLDRDIERYPKERSIRDDQAVQRPSTLSESLRCLTPINTKFPNVTRKARSERFGTAETTSRAHWTAKQSRCKSRSPQRHNCPESQMAAKTTRTAKPFKNSSLRGSGLCALCVLLTCLFGRKLYWRARELHAEEHKA